MLVRYDSDVIVGIQCATKGKPVKAIIMQELYKYCGVTRDLVPLYYYDEESGSIEEITIDKDEKIEIINHYMQQNKLEGVCLDEFEGISVDLIQIIEEQDKDIKVQSQRFGKETTKEQENVSNFDSVARNMTEQIRQMQQTSQKE